MSHDCAISPLSHVLVVFQAKIIQFLYLQLVERNMLEIGR